MEKEKYILITGASAGIGEACATLLAKEGRNLILLARRKERLDELKARLEKKHPISVLVYPVDLGSSREIDLFFDSVEELKIEAVINNAGLALGKSSLEDYDWNDIDQMIDINIKAFTKVAQRSIPHLKKMEGHLINISSVSGLEAYEGGSVYCGTKAFVKMLSKGLRMDLAGTGIRVTDIAPGMVETEFSVVRFKGNKEVADSVYKGFTPLYANDIAEAVSFALSRPKSVTIESMLIMPTAQASATRIVKKT